MVEFAEQASVRGFFGKAVADPRRRQSVEDAELAFAKALVDDGVSRATGQRTFAADDLGRFPGADVWRGKDHLGPFVAGQGAEPPPRGPRLVTTQLG